MILKFSRSNPISAEQSRGLTAESRERIVSAILETSEDQEYEVEVEYYSSPTAAELERRFDL